jgi:hypothetical protein
MAEELPSLLDYDLAIRKYWDTYAQKAIQEAREGFQRERQFYTWALGLTATFAGVLLGLATFLGFTSIKNAESAEIAKVQQQIDAIPAKAATQIQDKLSTELTAERLQKALTEMAAKLAGPNAEAKLAQILAEQNYLRLDGHYFLRNDSSGLYLDVLNAGKDQPQIVPVDAIHQANQSWAFVKR